MSKTALFVLMFFAMLGWGGSWVNVKVLSSYIGAFELIFLRYFITCISMAPILIYLKKSFKIDIKSLTIASTASIVMTAYTYYFFLGTKYGTASLGGAFVTTLIPINTFIILVLFFRRKIEKRDAFALFLGAFGVMSILGVWHLDLKEIFVLHNGYFIIASLLWPILTLVSAKSTNISPFVFTFYMYGITSLLSLLFFDLDQTLVANKDLLFWLNIFSISIISTTFSTTVYFMGIETLGAKEVSGFIFLVPFAAIGLSAIFLGEIISAWMVFGTVLTVVAVAIINHFKFPILKINLYKKKEK